MSSFNKIIGSYSLEIPKLDKLGTYEDHNDFIMFNSEETAIEQLSGYLKNAICKAACNKLVRKKYKNKMAVLNAIKNNDIQYKICTTKIINSEALDISHEELVNLVSKVQRKEITFDEYYSLAIGAINDYYDIDGNHIDRCEVDSDYIFATRRELSDYNDKWEIYNIGDIVELKEPKYVTCCDDYVTIPHKIIRITDNPITMDCIKDNKYCIGWGNWYEGIGIDGDRDDLIIEIHYEDIARKISDINI